MDGGTVDGVVDLGGGVTGIDTRMGGYDGITNSYLIASPRPCLVETGTARSAARVVEVLRGLGVGPGELATVVVTHVHLDHAGGAGDLAAAFPKAQVVVHERGARHLADPARLLASARRVFGEALDRVFGPLAPTPADRLVALGDTGRVDLGGGRRLEAFHAPGHASHHLGLVDTATGDLYTGDAAGVYVPETAELRPATPPPDFDLDLALASLRHMRDARPRRLLFSHFGPIDDADAMLERAAAELRGWVAAVRGAYDARMDLDHAVALLRERAAAARTAAAPVGLDERLEELSSTAANVAGVYRWLDRAAEDGPAAPGRS